MQHPSSFRTQRRWPDCRMIRELYPCLPIGLLRFWQHKGAVALEAPAELSQKRRPIWQRLRFLRARLILVGTTTPIMKPDLRSNDAPAPAVRTSLKFPESMRTSRISPTLA